MPSQSERDSFPVVTWLTVSICVLMVGAQFVRRYLPDPERNDVALNPRPYLSAAGNQDIEWQPFSIEKIEEAKAQGRPIFLVIGTQANALARTLDQESFRDPDVSDASRSFLCLRADSMVRPDLIPSILPISYAQIHRDTTLLLCFFDSELNLMGTLHKRRPDDRIRAGELSAALKSFLSRARAKPESWDVMEQHNVEVEQLANPEIRVVADVDLHVSWLKEAIDPEAGTWPAPYALMPNTEALTCLFNAGEVELVENSLRPMIAGGMFDWIHGGFFTRATRKDWGDIEFDKMATLNAHMAHLLARLYCRTKKPIYQELSIRTIEMLISDFYEGGLVHPYEVGKRGTDGRSAVYSVRPRQMGEWLSPTEQEIARNSLDLIVERNPQMIPRFSDFFDAEKRSRAEPVLEKIRKFKTSTQREIGGIRTPAVATLVTARLREAANLLGYTTQDKKLTTTFIDLAGLVDNEGRIRRSVDLLEYEEPTLTDLVGMADSNLTDAILTGSPLSAEVATDWMLRALKDFRWRGGPMVSSLSEKGWGPTLQKYISPNIADGHTASPIAQAMRAAYGVRAIKQMLGTTNTPEYAAIEDFLNDASTRFGNVSNLVNRRYSGYVNASKLYLDDTFWVVSLPGGEARTVATELRRLSPSALVLPYDAGSQRSTRVDRPGIYQFKLGELIGPIPRAQAETLLQNPSAEAAINRL